MWVAKHIHSLTLRNGCVLLPSQGLMKSKDCWSSWKGYQVSTHPLFGSVPVNKELAKGFQYRHYAVQTLYAGRKSFMGVHEQAHVHETSSLPLLSETRNGWVAIFPRAVKIQGKGLGKVETSLHSHLVVKKAVMKRLTKVIRTKLGWGKQGPQAFKLIWKWRCSSLSLLPLFHPWHAEKAAEVINV